VQIAEDRPATTDAPIRLGVIGVGRHAGQILIPAIQRCRDLRIVALATAHPASSAVAAARFGYPTVVGSGALLARDDVESVVITTPAATQVELTLAALAAGKHVFCETPGLQTPEDARLVAAALAASDRVLSYGTCLRYAPIYRQARQLIPAVRLGEQVVVTLRYYAGLRHTYDLATYLLGEVRAVTCTRVGAQTVAQLSFAGGDLAIVHGGGPMNLGIPLELVEASGPGGLLSARGGRELWSFVAPEPREIDALTMSAAPATVWAAPPSIAYGALNQLALRGYVPELDAFALAIREGGATESGLDEAARTMRVVRAAERAAAEGREVPVEPVFGPPGPPIPVGERERALQNGSTDPLRSPP
jgi:predicted dehydrogenase